MALKVKKKKKKLGGRSRGSGGTSGKKVTPARPYAQAKLPPCQKSCPMGNDIRRALTYVAQSETYNRSYDDAMEQAWYIFTNTNPMPSVLGRVCPHPCEDTCNRKDKDGALNINQFERSLGDYGLEKKLKLTKLTDESSGKSVAVVGAGPAGVSCAYQLARRGHKVTLFEAFPKAGGMIRYGIPPYRLPREVIDAEIQRVVDLGVELKTNTIIGKDITVEQLRKDHDAVYIGIGCHKGRTLGAPGEDAANIMTGAEFLHKINSGETIDVGNDVVVVGGGDSAIDAARVCKRLGANTTIVYRRTKKEMPAISHEIDEAEAEGIAFEFLSVPIEAVKEGNTAVKLVCQRMELGEPDSSGRRRPVPIEGDTYERTTSMLIPAISQEPQFPGDMEQVGNAKDWVKVDKDYFRHEMEGVYGGGDAYSLGLVTIAVGQGAKAAEVIDGDLRGEKIAWPEPLALADKVKHDFYNPAERKDQTIIPVDQRWGDNTMTLETNQGITRDDAIEESKRCFSCGMCMDCDNCWMYCQDQAVEKLAKDKPIGEHYYYKHDLCTGCDKCAEECPCGYLDMR
jgi:NADPH-dependent glutamate synthase beta subunit-like oxidoreductase/Pyruvate/2-oxoacid:ferredoxin oxidoreductase delta subunit